MFGIFKRTTAVRELMSGFHDLHSHILPFVDDGSKSEEYSRRLIDELEDMGVRALYCTPHIIADVYPNNNNASMRACFDDFKCYISRFCNIDIRLAAEYLIDESFMKHVLNDPLTFNKKHILVEFNMRGFSESSFETLFRLSLEGYVPVIAHPERYRFLHDGNSDILSRLIEIGCKMQLNLLSVSGWHGKEANYCSEKMLDSNSYDFVGSDTHSMLHIGAINSLSIPRKYVAKIEQLKENNISLF